MSVVQGFKIVRTDGTSRGGYQWPLPTSGERVRVDATNPTAHNDPCPRRDGDGLCVAKTAAGASAGGISLASCIGLLLEYDTADVLAEDEHKLRVRGVWVTGVFDVLAVIRCGLAPNLWCADLRGAYLRGADLRGATGRTDWDQLIERGATR
jgi:hypothetical protein